MNTRDLGGLPRRGGVTRPGVFIRSDHLGQLNTEGREAMRAYGVTTILDLRSRGELERTPSPFADGGAVRYVNLELIDDANMNNIGDSGSMLERYLFIIRSRPQAFRDVFTALAESDGTVIFHCFAGKDRTGVVSAMILELAQVPREHIAADYGETDVQLAQQYAVWIGEAEADKQDAFREELRCPPERILGVLDQLDREWGGVAGYLESAGMSAANIEKIGAKLS